MICTTKGCKKLAEWDFGDERYCQMCWEAYCSEEWWSLNVFQNGQVANDRDSFPKVGENYGERSYDFIPSRFGGDVAGL